MKTNQAQPKMEKTMNHEETTVLEPEVIPPETEAVERRSPAIPVTLVELAAMKGEALEIIQARITVLETLRKASIRATSPEDWLLFKAKDGSVIGYLQDCGCQRVRDLYGCEVFDVSEPVKVVGSSPETFHYIIRGNGRCKLTRQTVENIEGGRSSTDDFCQGKVGAQLELDVRKAARANLDGNIVRELTGLKSVPLQELEAAWANTAKKSANCRKGRGFGSQAVRDGQAERSVSSPHNVTGPPCEKCAKEMIYRPAGTNKTTGGQYDAYWKCPEYAKGNGHSAMKDSDVPRETRAPGEEG